MNRDHEDKQNYSIFYNTLIGIQVICHPIIFIYIVQFSVSKYIHKVV